MSKWFAANSDSDSSSSSSDSEDERGPTHQPSTFMVRILKLFHNQIIRGDSSILFSGEARDILLRVD